MKGRDKLMWITDLQTALNELFEIYGLYCCVEYIHANVITMTNRDRWLITAEGHIEEIKDE